MDIQQKNEAAFVEERKRLHQSMKAASIMNEAAFIFFVYFQR